MCPYGSPEEKSSEATALQWTGDTQALKVSQQTADSGEVHGYTIQTKCGRNSAQRGSVGFIPDRSMGHLQINMISSLPSSAIADTCQDTKEPSY